MFLSGGKELEKKAEAAVAGASRDRARDFYESCSQLQLERFTECARLCSL